MESMNQMMESFVCDGIVVGTLRATSSNIERRE